MASPVEDAQSAYLARIAAVAAQARKPVVFSHVSAAVLWGARTWRVPGLVHVTQPSAASARRSRDVARHRTVLGQADTTVRAGVTVTTLDRTLADCAMSLRPLAALVVADSLVRRGADLEAATEIVRTRSGANGSRLARWVLDHADGGAESPGESATRYVLLAHGFPAPELQVPVVARGRVFRADLGWRERCLLVEFDGLVKYRQLAGGNPSEVVIAEKRRQEAIEETGMVVVRVVHPELFPAEAFVARVARHVPPTARTTFRPVRELLLPTSWS
ncbi:hypothetical protein [Sanguibacter sp. 25GB23B1]|uniref:hypothetical protein n=1 Tax=unclassified Sanguibacter TaxID=2645534 RepID=UPI0032AFC487